jgi:hypothetical protein
MTEPDMRWLYDAIFPPDDTLATEERIGDVIIQTYISPSAPERIREVRLVKNAED